MVPPETLSPPFSVLSQPNNTDLGYTMASSFVAYLGYVDCGFRDVNPTNFPQITDIVRHSYLSSSSPTSPTSSFTLLSPSSQLNALSSPAVRGASSGPGSKDEIVLSVVLSTALVGLTIFGILAWLRYRKRKLAAATTMNKDSASSRVEPQPYLQRKIELEDEGTRIHELEGDGRRMHELETEDERRIHELEDEGRMIHELDTQSRIYEIGDGIT